MNYLMNIRQYFFARITFFWRINSDNNCGQMQNYNTIKNDERDSARTVFIKIYPRKFVRFNTKPMCIIYC